MFSIWLDVDQHWGFQTYSGGYICVYSFLTRNPDLNSKHAKNWAQEGQLRKTLMFNMFYVDLNWFEHRVCFLLWSFWRSSLGLVTSNILMMLHFPAITSASERVGGMAEQPVAVNDITVAFLGALKERHAWLRVGNTKAGGGSNSYCCSLATVESSVR